MIQEVRNCSVKKIPLGFLCRYFGVSCSGYYFWKNKVKGLQFVRKSEICQKIRESFNRSGGTYGSPRIYEELRDSGLLVSQNTVSKYMREMGLDARLKKRFKVQTTDSNHNNPVAPRLFKLEEHSLPEGAGELLAGDITYLRVGHGFLYLSVVLDLYNREVVGWSMGESLETGLVLSALDMAMRKLGPDVEVIFHSDRGSQYASRAYRNFLKTKGIRPSMSRRGNCYDNAYVESWFGSLKKEWIYRKIYSTREELKALVFEYIEVWYNKKRKHSSLGYCSPVEYRKINKIAH